MYLYQSSWFVVEGTTFVWNLTLSTSLILGNEPRQSDETKQMKGEVDSDTLMMIEDNKNKTFGVSSSTTKALETSQMQELNEPTTVDMPLMESMIHNRRCVSSSINGEDKISKKQETEGTTLGIQVIEDNNHIKTGVLKSSKR